MFDRAACAGMDVWEMMGWWVVATVCVEWLNLRSIAQTGSPGNARPGLFGRRDQRRRRWRACQLPYPEKLSINYQTRTNRVINSEEGWQHGRLRTRHADAATQSRRAGAMFAPNLQAGEALAAAFGNDSGITGFGNPDDTPTACFGYAVSAAIPALATCASSVDLTPDTPTAPTTWPSTTIGTPPSSMPSRLGAPRKEVRPLLIISS